MHPAAAVRAAGLCLFLAACSVTATGDEPAEEVSSSQTAARTRTIPWSVSRHVWPGNDALLATDLDRVKELGAKYVRADVVHTDRSKKAGFGALKRQIGLFSSDT